VDVRLKIVTGIIVLLALNACDRQATGQSVAVVNGEEISRGELNAELQRANLGEGPEAEQVRPQLLQRVIDRRLLAQKAVAEGIDRTPEFVIRERELREQLLIDLLSQRLVSSMPAPTPQQLAAFISENPGMFAQRGVLLMDQIQFARPADPTILNELRGDHTLPAVSTTLTRLGVPHQAGTSRVDTADLPANFVRQISSLPAGEPFIVPAPGGFVVSVIRQRQPVQVSAEESRRIATEAWRRRQLQQQIEQIRTQLRQQASIEYQPGFEPRENNQQAPAAQNQTK
jgi:peptidyl-prolyl cis-trans isomerase C